MVPLIAFSGIIGCWTYPLGISFGLVKERPIVVGGKVVPATTFTLGLNWDRRVMGGAEAARFFKRIVDILEFADKEMSPYLPVISNPLTAQNPH